MLVTAVSTIFGLSERAFTTITTIFWYSENACDCGIHHFRVIGEGIYFDHNHFLVFGKCL